MIANRELESILFDHLPKQKILACYRNGRGQEIESGKFASPTSSAALVANAFGYFLERPATICFPTPANLGIPISLDLEVEMRFPWRGGLHPQLDAVLETDTHLIGIESKRYEPFRDKKNLFSDAFQRPVWGDRMQAYEKLRDELSFGYLHLDPVQLVKHAFGIRTRAMKHHKRGVLIYVYAEPAEFPDGKPVFPNHIEHHRREVERFANSVDGAEVEFFAFPYTSLLTAWQSSSEDDLREHAKCLRNKYQLGSFS